MVIRMECDGELLWVKLLREVLPTQNVYQWLYWITNPSSGDGVHNIDWIIAVFPGTKKNDRRKEPDIKSWAQPVKAFRDLLKKSCNIKG